TITAGRSPPVSPRLRSSPDGPRSSSVIEFTGSALISRSSGRFLYVSGAVVNVDSSGSVATIAQSPTAIASASAFHPRFSVTQRNRRVTISASPATARPAPVAPAEYPPDTRRCASAPDAAPQSGG